MIKQNEPRGGYASASHFNQLVLFANAVEAGIVSVCAQWVAAMPSLWKTAERARNQQEQIRHRPRCP